MNVEIGTEAAQFSEKEYIFGIMLQCKKPVVNYHILYLPTVGLLSTLQGNLLNSCLQIFFLFHHKVKVKRTIFEKFILCLSYMRKPNCAYFATLLV
jgi:hypothetical protein